MKQSSNNQDTDLMRALDEKLRPLIEHSMTLFGTPGLAIGIVKAGELIYSKGFGVRNVESGEPVSTRSLFHLASISKTFVAAAIIQLVEQGKVELNGPVVHYLPYFRLNDDRASQITVQHLLNHTSGLAAESGGYDWHKPEVDEGALERYVRSLDKEKLLNAPGTTFSYSNISYEVLGALIAKVSGQTFEEYMRTHIFGPLRMDSSTFLREEVPADLAVTPHFGAPCQVLGDAYPYHRGHAPSSTLQSSVDDMARWAIAHLNRGRIQHGELVAQESHKLLWQPTVKTGEQGWEEAVGLGWFLGRHRGHALVYHGGSDPGFNAQLVLIPQEDAAAVILTNDNSAVSVIVSDAAVEILAGLEPEMPKIPIAVIVGATLAAKGAEEATKQYHQLAQQVDSYDASADHFADAVWGAIEMHQPEVIQPLVELWLTLQPEEYRSHEMMGWIHVVRGDKESALRHLHRTIELNPDAWYTKILLEKLKSAG